MTKAKAKVKYVWERSTYKLVQNWYQLTIVAVLMLVLGYIIGWAAGGPLPIVQVTQDTLWLLMRMWAMFILAGRGWQIAKYPRKEEVKLKDLKGNFMAVFHLNFVSWFHFILSIIFAYSLAPEIGQIAKAFE